MELLTQIEIINEINKYSNAQISRQAFSKRVKKGQIKFYYKPDSKKKFYKLHEVAKVYGIKIGEIESSTPATIKNDETIYTLDYKEELNNLLKDVDTPVQKVAVIKDFWDGKIKELKAKEAKGELLSKQEVTAIFQVGITNFKTKMYEIPHNLKAQYPDASIGMIDALHLLIDKAFDELSKASIR